MEVSVSRSPSQGVDGNAPGTLPEDAFMAPISPKLFAGCCTHTARRSQSMHIPQARDQLPGSCERQRTRPQ